MPRDSKAMTDQVENFDPLTGDQMGAMRLLIAGNAKGRSKKAQVEDAVKLMKMLGVHPSQENDWQYLVAPNSPVNRSWSSP